MSDSLWPHESEHSRPPCPSPSSGVHSNSRRSSRWCHPAISSSVIPFSPCPQSLPASESLPMSQLIGMRRPKYWSFSFSIIPSKEHPGLISFRMDWLGLLAVQGTLKSLLQHHSSKVSILRRSAFFIVKLSHSYMTTGKTIALTRRTFIWMCLITATGIFIMYSKCFLSWYNLENWDVIFTKHYSWKLLLLFLLKLGLGILLISFSSSQLE